MWDSIPERLKGLRDTQVQVETRFRRTMVERIGNETDCNMPQGSCWSTAFSGFYLFLARHSGRRRASESEEAVRRQAGGGGSSQSLHRAATYTMFNFLLLVSVCLSSTTHACSSRSTPKPRPLQPTARPNVTFHTYPCPPVYAKWYCLNEATCFAIKIGESLLYNCECTDGYMGQRCEFKNLDGSYTTARRQVMLESASIASGVSVAVLLVFIICTTFYVRSKRQRKLKSNQTDFSMVDGKWSEAERRPFSYRPKHTIVTIPLKTQITEHTTTFPTTDDVDCRPEECSRQEPLIV